MQKIIVSAFCSLILANASFAENLQSKRMNMRHIEVALPSFPDDIDPMKVWSYYHYMLVQSLYSTLVRIDESGRLVSYLATKWTVSNDGKSIHFYMAPEVRFTDGSPVTSKDVAFSLARHCWPNSPSIIKGYLADKIQGMDNLKSGQIPKGIEVKSNTEFVIHLNRPYAPFMHLLAMPGFSIVKENDPYKGAGPMTGQFNKSTQHWDLKNSTSYFGKKTKLNSITVRAVSGKEVIEKSFHKDAIDIILGVPIGDINNFNLPSDVTVKETDTLSFNHLFYNTDNVLFKDQSFRKDFGILIQDLAWKPEYLSQFLEKQNTLLPKGVMPKDYYENVSGKINYSEFIKKWQKTIQSKNLKIVVIPGHFNKKFLDDLEKTLTSLGLEITLIRASTVEYAKAVKEKNYDIISGPYIGNFPDPDGFIEPFNEKSGMKFGTYDTKPFLEKLEDARFIKDASERMKIYSKTIKNFESEWSFVPLYRMNFPIIHHKKLTIPDSSYRYEAELWNVFWN